MKPMLLFQKNPSITDLSFPLYVLPKLDGIRCLITSQGAVSRTLKAIPNEYISTLLATSPLGLDGELIVGCPTAKDVYRTTNSGVMSTDGKPEFKYYVFDLWNSDSPYWRRQQELIASLKKDTPDVIEYLNPLIAQNSKDLERFEASFLEEGYEGIIIRNPSGMYKQGRTTLKENNAFKLKRFEDSEATVVGIIPEFHNANELKRDATGKIQRSTHAAGLVAKESMGALLVYDPKFDETFQIGTGFTKEDRLWWWKHGQDFAKKKGLVTYKYFPVGVKEKPRHPVFKGIRSKIDV